MTKQDAISEFGEDVVQHARDMYETDFGKVIFSEDCIYENDYPLNDEEQKDYLRKARAIGSSYVKD